jgi:ankyrin repeat protein
LELDVSFQQSLQAIFRTIKAATALMLVAGFFVLIAALNTSLSTEEVIAAARAGDIAVLQRAANLGMNLNIQGDDGFTPLMEASRAGQCDAVQFLLKHHANIDAGTPVFGTSLHVAAMTAHPDVLALLLSHHANPNATTDLGITPLMFAAISSEQSAEMTSMLLRAGAEPNAHSTGNWTPLNGAIASDNHEAARLIQAAGGKQE